MSYLRKTNIGIIIPYRVFKFRSLETPLISKFIVFQTNYLTYKGIVKWYGEINDIKAFGIETDPIEMGTDGEFNNFKIFNCKPECGILVEESVNYLETDEWHGFVKYKEFKIDKKYINSKSRLVYVRFKDECRIGKILNGGFINGIYCFHIKIVKELIEYYVIENDILDFVNDDGIVLLRKDAVLNIEDCNEDFSLIIDKRVRFQYNNEDEIGVLKWKGKIDFLKCVGVDPNNAKLISDWTKHFNPNAYWTIICLDFLEEKGISIMFEIEDPFNCDIFTYLKKKTFVKIKGDEGIITSYFTDKRNLFYEIKMDDNETFVIANCNEVKCGAVAKKENKCFVTMRNPDDHGVLTKFNINYYVEIKPDSENKLHNSCFGFLVWMGFDGDRTLRFLINLEYPDERASSGTFYGQKLHDIKNKHGLLVYPDCLIPFGYVPGRNSSYEIIHPSKFIKLRSLKSPLIYKLIVFQINSSNYKGTVKWYGEINDIRAFGIETDPIKMGIDGELNNCKIFNYKPECGILIEESVKYLETDELHGFVNFNEFKVDKKYINSKSRLVYVRFKDECRIGRILNGGFINEMICFHIKILKESIEYFVIIEDILDRFVNDDGIVLLRKDAVLNIEDCNEDFSLIIDKRVRFQYNNEDEIGVLKWKGKIDGLKCIGVDPHNENLISDWTKHFNPNAYWTIICLDFLEEKGISIMFEIEDPFNCDIFTYLKKKTFVKIKGDEGIITSYFTDKRNLFYEIKMDDNKTFVIANCNEVKCGAVAKKENKSFVTMISPDDHGVLTKFNINDYVEIKPDSENKLQKSCFGFLVWMGFDGDRSLKFLINLEYPNERASRGTFYGQKLHDIKNKHGLLVYPDCLIPFGYVPGNEYQAISQESSIVDDYQFLRSLITCGENKGIQGCTNSSYIETSLFAMFTFQELFDNLLILPRDEINLKIVNILRTKIIFPLRKYEYVSFSRVGEFREILAILYPEKKFLCSEKDPVELLDTLFHLLTPRDPLLRTFDIKSQKCQNYFTTQLFYTNKNNSGVTTIKEMLNWTFLESGILIDKPPKCLILQLPRNGTLFKQNLEVEFSSTLDITDLVRCGDHYCSQCIRNGTIFCLSCSEEKENFTYFCSDHKTHCIHPRKTEIVDNKCPLFKGRIKLELFAILCMEKTRYVAYVKTGAFPDKWIYYDSMATSDKYVMKPLIRDTSIGKYFAKNVYHSNIDEDLTRIKKFAFVCFYKNLTLEYYIRDFNKVEK